MQDTITRKIFGQAISYHLTIEECKTNKDYFISVECLQPESFQQMLSNSPQLLKNKLVSVVRDAAYDFNHQVQFQEPFFISSSEKDVCIQARFSCK